MPAGSTYSTIATNTVSGTSTNSVSFTSIPSTYTDLILVINSSKTTSGVVNSYLRFNNDSSSNYSSTFMYGDGSSAASARQSNVTWAQIGDQADVISTTIVQIQNYSNSTTNKTFLTRYNNTATGDVVYAGVQLWRSTAAINRIDCLLTASNFFTAGSTLTLYGIAAA